MGPTAALVLFWLAFASQATGLPIPNVLPVITLADHFGPYRIGPGELTAAGTSVADGHITFPLGWRGVSEDDNCLAAHELTHYLQIRNHQRFACLDAMEPAAYRVMAACYRLFGNRGSERWALGEAARKRCGVK